MPNITPVVQYLEKYTVAPSPSRDYYGVKVFNDQVTLYTWRISHGPHTHPIVRITKFDDFFQDRTMQDEIQRIFGDPIFRHVKAIVEGNGNSLLTLPKNLIVKLTKYLGLIDVVNLSTVSRIANEVFNADSVWEVLYKRKKMGLLYRDERERAGIYGWKEIFKERQMHKPAKDRKLKKASSLYDFPSQRSATPIKFNASMASISPLKEHKIAKEGKIMNQKSSSVIKSRAEIEGITARSGSIKTIARYSENSLAKQLSSFPPADSKELIVKAASNDEILRRKFKKKLSKAEKKNDDSVDERPSSRIGNTERRILLEKSSIVVPVNEKLDPSKNFTRKTSSGDVAKGFSNRNLPISGKKVSTIYDKFPTPRKPAFQTGKLELFKDSVAYKRGEKSHSVEPKMTEGIIIGARTKSKARSLLTPATENPDSLKFKSTSTGSVQRGVPNKQDKINKKTKNK